MEKSVSDSSSKYHIYYILNCYRALTIIMGIVTRSLDSRRYRSVRKKSV